MTTITAAEYQKQIQKPTANKYRAKRTFLDGYTFDSRLEARRYSQLKLLQKANQIHGLVVHPKFDLTAHSPTGPVYIGTYTPEFAYYDMKAKKRVVEECKSKPTRTEAYKLRKKIFQANYGITITEVML